MATKRRSSRTSTARASRKVAGNMKQAAREDYDRVRKQLADAGKSAKDYARRNPERAAAIAAAAGAVIGAIAMSAARRNASKRSGSVRSNVRR